MKNMKNINVYFLFLSIINASFQVVPLWNFQAFTFDLLANQDSFTYIKYEKTLHSVHAKLERKIYKENGEIKIKHLLYLDYQNYGETEFDDIESFYRNSNNNYLICPKGKHHIYLYYKETQKFETIVPNDFPNINDWDLMCYYQYQDQYQTLFVAYLGEKTNFYQFLFHQEKFKMGKTIQDGIHAFKWRTSGIDKDENNPEKPMLAIVKNGDKYLLDYINMEVKTNNEDFNYRITNNKELTLLKSNYLACFQIDTYNFYWINYNNASDFEIGSYTGNEDLFNNFKDLNFQIFTESPLKFFEKITIIELKFIFAMYFAYYKIKNDKGKIYYGIIDVPRNRVIFNTDEEIIKYIPLLDYAMLAITKTSAYKICVSRNENDCQRCDDSQFMLDSSKYNFCGNNCKTKYILMPDNICSDTCDERIFIIKNNKCGLCKDLGDGNVYKFYNQPGCLKEKPENSIYVNEDLKIIDCDNNYKYENGRCIQNCHNNCDKCSMYSTDINNQKCTSCKNGELFLQEGNCVEKCSNNYFLNNKNCKKCDNSCETCDKASNNCTSCKDGKYIDKTAETYICKNCNDNCETCEFNGDNCITCNQASSFKYFFNSSCYENCPKNTILNEKNNICEENNNDENKNHSNNDSVMLLIFTIITAGLLSLTLFCFFRRYCRNNKKSSDNLLNEINTELREN